MSDQVRRFPKTVSFGHWSINQRTDEIDNGMGSVSSTFSIISISKLWRFVWDQQPSSIVDMNISSVNHDRWAQYWTIFSWDLDLRKYFMAFWGSGTVKLYWSHFIFKSSRLLKWSPMLDVISSSFVKSSWCHSSKCRIFSSLQYLPITCTMRPNYAKKRSGSLSSFSTRKNGNI